MQDTFGHSALYYSIITKHQGITNLLLEYLCKIINSPIKDISSYISLESISNDLGLIITNSSEILDSFFCNVLFQTIKEPFFGTPKEPLPACYLSELCISYPDNFTQSSEENIPLAFKASPFVIPSALGSISSLKMIKAILTSKNENIFRTEFIQLFIIQKWKTVIFWVYLSTFLIWLNIFLLVLLIDNPSEYYSIPLFVVNLILSGSEITQIFIIGKEYFTSKTNILDIFRMIFTISFIISLRVFDVKNNDINWMTMFLNLIKGISGFKAFSNTRYYIRLLSESIYGMKDFLIVFVYTIISLGLLNAISGEQKILTFESVWMNSFGLVVGNTDNFYSGSFVQHITFIIAITLNLIIMLNMVISLLGDSFDEFQLNAEIYNYKEMLEVIFEIEQVMSLSATNDQFSYFHVCMHSYEQTGSGWKGKVMDTRTYIKEKLFEEDLKPLIENNILSVNRQILGVESSVRNIDSTIRANTKNTENTISTIKTKIVILEENIKEVNEKITRIDTKLETLLSLLSTKT
ncbi:hypothetical protein SteCoe_28711 [Stentor coeruleus]|uniref:Ion transport domain-containing protein n=1 Tax=Stentor coeruleus TaxID=5963 RepID=A0A1R2B7I6_9CILI|nr:hypothetical protein SteCoe_28711 [Stentor coeruleus]